MIGRNHSKKIKLLIVDDHMLIRTIIRRLLKGANDIEIIGEASNADEALNFLRSNTVDIILLDIDMPGVSGLEITRRLQKQENSPKVIIFTGHTAEPFPTQTLNAGAACYLNKGSSADELLIAIRETYQQGSYMPEQLAQQMLKQKWNKAETPFSALSARDMEIFLLMCQGENANSISDKLFLSYKTVVTYRHKIFKKLGVRNNVDMIKLALEYDIIAN